MEVCTKCKGADTYDCRYAGFDWRAYPVNVSKQKQFIDSFIRDYEKWEQKGLGLYIWGRAKGSGKTHLAKCISDELRQKYGIQTKFVSASDLLNICYHDEFVLSNCRMLIIDDLRETDLRMSDVLFNIIAYRMHKKLVTLFTSRIKMADLVLDDKIVECLYKMCQPIPLPDYSVGHYKSLDESYDIKLRFFRDLGLWIE